MPDLVSNRRFAAWLILLPVVLLAGTPDHAANLLACKNGLSSCDQSRLTRLEARAVAVATHERQVSDCTDGICPCDPSALSERETEEVARPAPARRPIASTAWAGAITRSSRRRRQGQWRGRAGAQRLELHVRLGRMRPLPVERAGNGGRGGRGPHAERVGLPGGSWWLRLFPAQPDGSQGDRRRRARAQPRGVPGRPRILRSLAVDAGRSRPDSGRRPLALRCNKDMKRCPLAAIADCACIVGEMSVQ